MYKVIFVIVLIVTILSFVKLIADDIINNDEKNTTECEITENRTEIETTENIMESITEVTSDLTIGLESTYIPENKIMFVQKEKTNTTATEPNTIEEGISYSNSDLQLLAKLIYAEAGSDICSDEAQLLVGNVVLNRVKSKYFPNTIKGVIYEGNGKQYGCVANGMINNVPNQRAYDNAKKLLEGERYCPDNVIWQAEFKQGQGVYKKVDNIYFCYSNY